MKIEFTSLAALGALIAISAGTGEAGNTPPKGERAELGAVIYKYSMGETVAVKVEPNQQVICDTCPKTMKLAEYRDPVINKIKLNSITAPGKEQDEEAPSGPVREVEIKQPTEEKEKLMATIRFKLDSAKLDKVARKQVAELAAGLKGSSGEVFIGVDGYTCRLGGKKYNDKLAKRRAEAVAGELKKQGVKVSRVTGSGVCCYVDNKHLEPNRRVEVFGKTNKEEGK